MKLLAVDTETTGLDVYSPKTELILTATWNAVGKGTIYPKGALIPQLADASVTKLLWNAKFDISILENAGYTIAGKIIDVALMARVLMTDEVSYGLKHFARKYLGTAYHEEIAVKAYIRKNKLKTKDRGYADIPKRILYPYALKDVQCTFEMFHLLLGRVQGNQAILKQEHQIQKIALGMEREGIRLDRDRCLELTDQVEARLDRISAKLEELTGDRKFNPRSNAQVARQVYNGVRSPTRWSEKSGLPQVDEVALLRAGGQVAPLVLEYRRTAKALSTYLKPLAEKTRTYPEIHPSLNSAGARTGRFSSSEPNLQNLPRPNPETPLGMIRSMFVPRPGFRFLFIDYEQIELRLAAHFAADKGMIAAIHRNEDLHAQTAVRMFRVGPDHPKWKFYRYLAKTLNFSILYGTGPTKFADTVLAQSTKMGEPIVLSAGEAWKYVSEYKVAHPQIMKLFESVDVEVRRTGGIKNPFGRFISVPSWKTYVGVNYLIQSTAADVMKQAMLRCHRFLSKGTRKTKLVLTVHDELIFELHHTEKDLWRDLVEIMEERTMFSVPLTAAPAIGKSWGEKKDLVRST